MKHLASHGAALAAGVMLIAGCGSKNALDTIPIRGEVIYNGKPLTEGTVVYLPAPGSKSRQATGPLESDGSFSLTTQSADDGAMKGEYQIIVLAYKPKPPEPKSKEELEALINKEGESQRGFIIPEKYTNPETSGLSDTVDENHSGFKKIELSD